MGAGEQTEAPRARSGRLQQRVQLGDVGDAAGDDDVAVDLERRGRHDAGHGDLDRVVLFDDLRVDPRVATTWRARPASVWQFGQPVPRTRMWTVMRASFRERG